jgi:exodeoxyribonuclease VIII
MSKIKLLDGIEYQKDELLKKMYDDNFYYGELNELALSSSSIKLLVDSPKKYYYVNKYGNKESQPLRDGTLLHTLILEPDKFEQFHFVDVLSKNSKAYKEAKAEFGTVYTKKERNDAERVADAVFKNEKAMQMLTDCEFEVPVIGNVMGMPFRGKADILGENRICDIKTTSDIKSFPYSAKKYGYDVQVFLYCNLFDKHYSDFQFLVVDKGSLDIGIWECSEEFYSSGGQKVSLGIDTYDSYFLSKKGDINDYYIKGTL